MMDLIIAILLYIGAVSSSTEVNETVINENQSAIEYYQNDPDFQEYYQSEYNSENVVILDASEGDM